MAVASQLSQGEAPLTAIKHLRERARNALDPESWGYLEAGTGQGVSLAAAEASWDRLRLRPRILRGVTDVDIATTVLGRPLDLPILTAPNGRATRFCSDGELALLEGVEAAGTLALLPSSIAGSTETLHRLRPKARFWQQIYWSADREALRSLIARLPAGCEALVLTVDLMPDGRPAPPPPSRAAWETEGSPLRPSADYMAPTWDDLAWLCAENALPVLVKGVLRGDDAAACVAAGARGLIVSNHGGNQLDTAIEPVRALAEVVDACAGSAEVLVDGGIRSGVSVLKALALGARAILVGRPTSYALAAGGAKALETMLTALGGELARAMALCGAGSLATLDSSLVREID